MGTGSRSFRGGARAAEIVCSLPVLRYPVKVLVSAMTVAWWHRQPDSPGRIM